MAKSQMPLKKISVNVTERQYDKLKKLGGEKGLPISRIITYLVNKALDDPSLFEYDLSLSEATGECLVGEDKVLFKFIKQCTNGVGLDYMLLYADGMGLNKLQVKNAVKKLKLERKIDYATMNSRFFDYPEDYLAFKKV